MARARTETEEVTLRLRQEVSGPAAVAGGAAVALASDIEGATAALRAMQGQARVESLGKIETEIVKGSGALKELQAQMRAMQKGPSVDIEQYRKLKGTIDQQTNAIARAKGEHAALAGFAKKSGAEAAKAGKDGSAGLDAATKAAKLLGGQAGALAASVLTFGKELMALGPYALAAGVALAVVAAGVVALVGFFVAGVKAADAFRNELLSLQGAMRGNAQAGKEAQAAINAVAGSAFNALPREKLAAYATQLGQMRVRGKDLQTALEAAAIAGSASGDAMAQSVLGAAAAASRAGQSVDQLAARVKRQLGGVAASQAFALDAQFRRMREDLTLMFSGSQFDPFLSGLQNITRMFGQSTDTGIKLKEAVGWIFNKLLAVATAALPFVKGALLGAAIAVITMYIVVKKVYNAIRDWASPLIKATGLFKDATIAIEGGKIAAYTLTAVFVAMGAAITIAMVPIGAVLGAIGLAIAAIVKITQGLYEVFSVAGDTIVWAFREAKKSLEGFSLSDIASNMVDSFVKTVMGKLGEVQGALSNMGATAVGALKNALGIHSPSRPAMAAADNVTGTFTSRVEDAAPDVQDSFDSLAMNPANVKSEAKAARSNGGAKIVYIELGGGSRDNASIVEQIREILRREFDADVRAVEPA